jgi:TusA-related sulfurtransferase
LKEKYGTDAQIFGDRINLVIDDDKSAIDDIKKMLQINNLTLINYRTITPSLENVFIHLVKKAS